MSVLEASAPAVGVQVKTGVVTSAKMAIAVAFLGAAALAAAAVAGMGGAGSDGSGKGGYGYGYNKALQPVIKEVSLEVKAPGNAKQIFSQKMSAAQGNLTYYLGYLGQYSSESVNNKVVVTVKAVDNADANTVYGYYVSYDTYSSIVDNNLAFKSQVIDKVVWTKSKQYMFVNTESKFYVYVLAKNADNLFTFPGLGIDDGTYMWLYNAISFTSSTTSTTPITPTSTAKQPIIDQTTISVVNNNNPMVYNNSMAKGNLPYPGNVVKVNYDTLKHKKVKISVDKVLNDDGNVEYGFLVVYGGNFGAFPENVAFKSNVGKAKWGKSSSYIFVASEASPNVYALVRNKDGKNVYSTLGLDDATLFKFYLASTTPATSTPAI
ncbi:MAG: hypothetical protein AAB390_04655 [Patescibacteria group bacterium]